MVEEMRKCLLFFVKIKIMYYYMRSKGFKSMNCKLCGEKVEKVDEACTAVTCSTCVSRNLNHKHQIIHEQPED